MKIPYHELPTDNEPVVTYRTKEVNIGDDRRVKVGHSKCGKVAVWMERDLEDGNTSVLQFAVTAEAARVLAVMLVDALGEME